MGCWDIYRITLSLPSPTPNKKETKKPTQIYRRALFYFMRSSSGNFRILCRPLLSPNWQIGNEQSRTRQSFSRRNELHLI